MVRGRVCLQRRKPELVHMLPLLPFLAITTDSVCISQVRKGARGKQLTWVIKLGRSGAGLEIRLTPEPEEASESLDRPTPLKKML